MHRTGWSSVRRAWLPLIVLAITLAARSVGAAPVVYADVVGDGINRGVPTVVASDVPSSLGVWFDAGEPFYEALVTLKASSGFAIVDYAPSEIVPPGDVNFIAGLGGSLALLTETATNPYSGPVFLGTLTIASAPGGGVLGAQALPGIADPSFTNLAFDYVPIPDGQVISAVPAPEPATTAFSSLLGLAFVLRLVMRMAALRAQRTG